MWISQLGCPACWESNESETMYPALPKKVMVLPNPICNNSDWFIWRTFPLFHMQFPVFPDRKIFASLLHHEVVFFDICSDQLFWYTIYLAVLSLIVSRRAISLFSFIFFLVIFITTVRIVSTIRSCRCIFLSFLLFAIVIMFLCCCRILSFTTATSKAKRPPAIQPRGFHQFVATLGKPNELPVPKQSAL